MAASDETAAEEQKDPEPYERTVAEASVLIEAGARLIDVRTAHEFNAGRLPDAERIGLEELAGRREELDPDRPVVFYCRVGNRSAMAAAAFSQAGLEAISLIGGIEAWVKEGRKIVPDYGYVSEPGEAASILEARARATSN